MDASPVLSGSLISAALVERKVPVASWLIFAISHILHLKTPVAFSLGACGAKQVSFRRNQVGRGENPAAESKRLSEAPSTWRLFRLRFAWRNKAPYTGEEGNRFPWPNKAVYTGEREALRHKAAYMSCKARDEEFLV